MVRQASHVSSSRSRLGKNKLHQTHNDMPEKTREKMAEMCNARLADASDLASQVRMAHWNVKGPHFIGLHKLFEEIYEAIAAQIDEIAERCVQMGGTAKGTVRLAAESSQLEEYPMDIITCEDHVREVSKRLSVYAKACREAIDEAEEADDMGTSDMFTEFVQVVDKYLWFVEAHMQADR
jgi:starvation-inducible DNA-binding protein